MTRTTMPSIDLGQEAPGLRIDDRTENAATPGLCPASGLLARPPMPRSWVAAGSAQTSATA